MLLIQDSIWYDRIRNLGLLQKAILDSQGGGGLFQKKNCFSFQGHRGTSVASKKARKTAGQTRQICTQSLNHSITTVSIVYDSIRTINDINTQHRGGRLDQTCLHKLRHHPYARYSEDNAAMLRYNRQQYHSSVSHNSHHLTIHGHIT